MEVQKIRDDIDKLIDKIVEMNLRLTTLEENTKKIEENLINELHLSAMPLITSSIDASKPELRNYINMVVKEQIRINS
mgnify:CR=1 FL=1